MDYLENLLSLIMEIMNLHIRRNGKMNKRLKRFRHSAYIKLYGEALLVQRAKWTERVVGQIPKGSRILDAGAGECKNKKYCGHLTYVSQDFCEYSPADKAMHCSSDADEWDYSKIDIVSDITEIPVEDSSFDAIICTEVFEHIMNPELAVKEFSRIINRGGVLITTTPGICGNHMAPYIFWHGISEYWYKEIYKKYGFEIKEMKRCGNYFDYMTEQMIQSRYQAQFYGKKINLFDSFILFCSSLVMRKYSKKTHGSETFVTDNIMVVAVKE